jgi:hypothetical protein
MPPSGGIRTSLSFSLSGPMGQAFHPTNGVFSPGLPIMPTQGQQVPRAIDFPVGWNTVFTPRAGYDDLHSFASLRAFANIELVRLAVETCKDQIEGLDWQVKPRDGRGRRKDDARIDQAEKLFRKPDGVTPFATWLRMWMEDLLVLDAPAIEKRRSRGGQLIGLDIIPGDTIKLLVDETGRRPKAPVPAYQQIIKGTVWANLTTDDLIYSPRNPRSNHMYGFGPVEQIIVTANTIMRRQAAQLGYFTEGNTPAGILNAPASWGPDAIRTMQDAWDARMDGDLAGKSKLKWVPEGTKYQPFKDSPLKDEFDEWLARVVCFTFSLPPTAFIKQMNRATAESSSNQADEEGTAQRKLAWKRVADGIIQDELGFDDLEWGWNDAPSVDPVKQATIDDLNLKNGSTTIDEVRDARGQDVLPDGAGEQPMIYLPTGPVLVKVVVEEALNPPEPAPAPIPPHLLAPGQPPVPGQEGAQTPHAAPQADPEAPKPPPAAANPKAPKPPKSAAKKPAAAEAGPAAEKLAKASASKRTALDRPLARRAQARARKQVAAVLRKVGDDVGAQVESHLQHFGKAAPADDGSAAKDLAALLAGQVDLDGLTDLDLSGDLAAVASDGASGALADVGVDASDDLTGQVHTRAVEWAKQRAGQLVSIQGGDNIVASTRNMVRDAIADGLAQNLGSAAIAEKVQESTAFSPDRAETIAKHEIATANEQGKLTGWKAAKDVGVKVQKGWQTSNNYTCCDDCQDNEEVGLIDLDDSFPSGDDAAPAHVNCECVTYPEVVGDDGSSEGSPGGGDEDDD